MLCVTAEVYHKTFCLMLRSYRIESEALIQDSTFDGEFSAVIIRTMAPLQPVTVMKLDSGMPLAPSITQQIIGEPADCPFEARISEMRHFLNVFRLFNPITIQQYEKKESSSSLFPE